MTEQFPLDDFIEVHSVKIYSIAQAIAELAQESDVRIEVELLPFTDPLIVNEEYKESDFESEESETASELSKIHNQGNIYRAKTQLIALQTFVTMNAMAELHNSGRDEGMKDLAARKITSNIFTYGGGTWQEAYYRYPNDMQLNVSNLKVHDIQDYKQANSLKLGICEKGVTDNFSVMLIDGTVKMIHRDTTSEDSHSFLNKIRSVFSPEESFYFLGRIARLELENARSTADVTKMFDKLWLEYAGSAREHEIAALVDEAEDRAKSMREGIALSSAHLTFIPTAEDLDKYVEVLGLK